jgi:hypothetical protein
MSTETYTIITKANKAVELCDGCRVFMVFVAGVNRFLAVRCNGVADKGDDLSASVGLVRTSSGKHR